MAKSKIPQENPPDLSLEQGKVALERMKIRGEQILSNRPVSEANFRTWLNATEAFIKRTFGSHSDHISTFYADHDVQVIVNDYQTTEDYLEPRRAKRLSSSIAAVSSIIEQISLELEIATPPPASQQISDESLWPMLHERVVRVSQALFAGQHYAEAAEAALKELNNAVKAIVGNAGGDLDGTGLMRHAFASKSGNPPILLEDLSTTSGRNIQEGYSHIFAGAMLGIRNPKAHGNLTISRRRAIHFLCLASLLFDVLDERRN